MSRTGRAGGLALHEIDPTESALIHLVEYDVRRKLMAEPQLAFRSLVVRRIPDGICLEGTLESCPDDFDIAEFVREVTGIEVVLNHLVAQDAELSGSYRIPSKG